jgi:hypothetical protein
MNKTIKYFWFRRQFSQAVLAKKTDILFTFLFNIDRCKMFFNIETLSAKYFVTVFLQPGL